jgi:antitoxin component HigA of HigAB toxin-antitoxin module
MSLVKGANDAVLERMGSMSAVVRILILIHRRSLSLDSIQKMVDDLN